MPKRSDQEEHRAAKRTQLIAANRQPYPARTERTVWVSDVLSKWNDGRAVTVAGRLQALRIQGASAFADLHDGTGKIQIFIQSTHVAHDDYQLVQEYVDLGDFLEIQGQTFVTKRGEKSVDAKSIRMLSKALRPLPSKWHGVENIELRYRHRELDILTNEDARTLFQTRSRIVSALRTFLGDEGYLEVETPILQAIPGGATARPFLTHHQSLDIDLYLRVAPELYLKRLIVAGYNRVFEIARCFRNEGVDREHNPEFTQIELYTAYTDYRWLMDLTERLLTAAVTAIHPTASFPCRGEQITWSTPFPRVSYHDAIHERTGIDIDRGSDAELIAAAQVKKTDVTPAMNRAKVIDELFKTHVRPTIIQPTFVVDYPIIMSPLAKAKDDNPQYAERFQLLMGGTELGNAFSELNDPVVQRERFVAQETLRAAGDAEAQRLDEDFLQAIEYGMPPTSGLGLGIDRLAALLTDAPSLKEVILFPTLKPSS